MGGGWESEKDGVNHPSSGFFIKRLIGWDYHGSSVLSTPDLLPNLNYKIVGGMDVPHLGVFLCCTGPGAGERSYWLLLKKHTGGDR